MACEIIIKIKDKFKSMTKKTMVYSTVECCYTDKNIDRLVTEATKNFGSQDGIKTSVTIKLFED